MRTLFRVLLTVFLFVVTAPWAAAEEPDSEAIVNLFNEGADAYNKERDYAKTLRLMDQVLETEPDNDGALYYRAQVYVRQSLLENASADVDRALELKPDEKRYLYLKGLIAEKRGDPAGATDWYSKALDQGFYSEALRARIGLFLAGGEYQKALDDCGWLHKHEPTSRTKMLRAQAFLGLGEYEEALADCDDVLSYSTDPGRLKDRTAKNLLIRADVYIKLGQAEDAYYDIVIASWLEETKVEPILALGDFFLLHRPNYRQAISYYTAAIEGTNYKGPKSAPSWERHEPSIARLRRGQAYVALDVKRFADEAIADFTRYVELEPNEPQGYLALAELYAKVGEPSKSAEWFEKHKGLLQDTPAGSEGDDATHATDSKEAPQ